MHRVIFSLIAIAVVGAGGSAGAAEWRSPFGQDHPLVGRIWQVAADRFATERDAERAAAGADIVLLGEKHDNADHHLLQARLIRAMIDAGRRPAVVFEMISEDRQPAIDGYRSAHPGDPAGLGAAVDWEASGWPPWPTYLPIARAVFAFRLPLRAGDLPRRAAEGMGRRRPLPLGAARRARLGLNEALSPLVADRLLEGLFEGHCALMPKAGLARLVDVQRARDAVLADNVAKSLALEHTDGAVLIAGVGHVRADYGAPLYLSRLAPERSVLSLAFVEVADGEATPAAYAARYQGALPFDFLWFTPRATESDYCSDLKERLKGR